MGSLQFATNPDGSYEALDDMNLSSNVSIADVGVDVPEPSTYMTMATGLALSLVIGTLRQKMHYSLGSRRA